MAPRRCGASLVVTKMAVGPSAPPMIPMELASEAVKPNRAGEDVGDEDAKLRRRAQKQGLRVAIRGAKSVIAPTPMKMSGG